MQQFEYRVVAAPTRGVKAKGIKTAEARFSNALEQLMNDMAAEGWEYQRAETLPSTERSGFTSTTTNWRNVLVFRRPVARPAAEPKPEPPVSLPAPTPIPQIVAPDTQEDDASKSEGASRMLRDNGVEDVSEVSGLTNSLTQLATSRNITKAND
ncbi:MAG: DUF4177 domain-containing protein [Roseobacter sp.]|jgi:hypothetical protein|nr:DUF4177 domain-containing protein [Roseobacter sp.]